MVEEEVGMMLTVGIAVIGLVTSAGALAIQSALSIIGLVGNIAILVLAFRGSAKAYFGRRTPVAKSV